MKKKYDQIEIAICILDNEDVITTSPISGEVDGDETKYPIPDGWAE